MTTWSRRCFRMCCRVLAALKLRSRSTPLIPAGPKLRKNLKSETIHSFNQLGKCFTYQNFIQTSVSCISGLYDGWAANLNSNIQRNGMDMEGNVRWTTQYPSHSRFLKDRTKTAKSRKTTNSKSKLQQHSSRRLKF